MQKILGISAFYHDSAACLTINGEVVCAAQEERFTRDKHTADFPVQAIKYCLEETGLSIDELDAIVFYDKPLIKFERLLQTYYTFAPKGLASFIKAIPVWLKEKLFLKKLIYDGLKEVGTYTKKDLKLLFSDHHLSHAASTYYVSPFEESAILTIDGVGEWSTITICKGEKEKITLLKEVDFPHSLGLLYSAFTYFLGFTVNSGEYKLMGLAPYGNPDAENTKQYISIIKDKLVKINPDGSIWLNQDYYTYATGLRMVSHKKWETLFGVNYRNPEDKLEQHHCDLALAIQLVTEEVVIKLVQEAKRITGSNNICLAGGVALNCVANGRILRENIVENIYIQSASGDAGGALGAALAVHYMHFENSRNVDTNQYDSMKGSYLGPDFSDKEIHRMNLKVKAVSEYHEDFNLLANKTAEFLSEGKVVGWFQGRMEFGPRALGNRSILGDARKEDMQKKLNLKIKYREGFRPFAPSVLKEDCKDYFDLETESPYMLLVAPVKKSRRTNRSENFFNLDLYDRLYEKRSDIQSVTHLDYSARVQTVTPDTNFRYWTLLNEFKKITGFSLLVNTSFNVRGEPIVCTPYDAYRCFMSTEMDYLVVGNYLYEKTKQPNWDDKEAWRVEFKMD